MTDDRPAEAGPQSDDAEPTDAELLAAHVAGDPDAFARLFARHRDRHGNGVLLALAGGSVAGLGAYLGGHLTEVRKISTRHPGFDR